MERYGWTLLFHDAIGDQLERLKSASDRAQAAGLHDNANVRLFNALSKLILEAVPQDPSREEYRQGKTIGPEYAHWRRAKVGRRFRLFFRYDSRSKANVYAWVNEENTLRSSGGRTDPHVVFRRMLERGNPPNDWEDLIAAVSPDRIFTP